MRGKCSTKKILKNANKYKHRSRHLNGGKGYNSEPATQGAKIRNLSERFRETLW